MTFFPSPHSGIRCLLQSVDSVEADGLLADEERARLDSLRVPKRRQDWLLGRWTAKQLVRRYLAESGPPPALDALLIRADEDGAPYAALVQPAATNRLPISLSISHSGPCSFCALSAARDASVGADIEMIEPRPLSLAEQFFTREELAQVMAAPEGERDALITLIWSAKEAFLKCVREGLRVDTRKIQCSGIAEIEGGAGWRTLTLTASPGLLPERAQYQTWWQRGSGYVVTLGLLMAAGAPDSGSQAS